MSVCILIAQQKGGVGKTTIADELAFALERRGYDVGVQNLDNQGGMVHEPTMLTGNEDYVVIDTPGYLGKEFSVWCKNADIILMPTQASNLDRSPLDRCWEVAGMANPKAVRGVVLNRFDPHRLLDKSFERFLANAEMLVLARIPTATAFAQANMLGQSVWDLGPTCKAAVAIEALADAVEEASRGR